MKKKLIVISAINFTEGGPLTVLYNLLDSFTLSAPKHYHIIVLINNRELLKDYRFEYIEFRNSKKSWFLRLYYEYIYFYFLSSRIKPYIWLSLHDITPFVNATYKLLYCHNPAPFYHARFNDLFVCPKFYLFSLKNLRCFLKSIQKYIDLLFFVTFEALHSLENQFFHLIHHR